VREAARLFSFDGVTRYHRAGIIERVFRCNGAYGVFGDRRVRELFVPIKALDALAASAIECF
jgi:hypothetical protein